MLEVDRVYTALEKVGKKKAEAIETQHRLEKYGEILLATIVRDLRNKMGVPDPTHVVSMVSVTFTKNCDQLTGQLRITAPARIRAYATENLKFRYGRIAEMIDIAPIGRGLANRTGPNFVEDHLLPPKADTANPSGS